MARITEDSFSPTYMDVRKHSDEDTTYPKLVRWALDAPLMYEGVQVSATILQRQMTKNSDWEFIPTIILSSPTISTNEEDPFGTDPYAETGAVTLPTEWEFADAIDAIYQKLDTLI